MLIFKIFNILNIKKFLFLFILINAYLPLAQAQSDTIYLEKQPTEAIDILRTQSYFIENEEEANLETIITKAKFEPFDWLKRSIYDKKNIWIKFQVYNKNNTDTLKMNFYFGKQKCKKYYSKVGQGNIIPNSINTQLDDFGTFGFAGRAFSFPIIIAPNTYIVYWVRLESFIYFNNLESYLIPIEKPQNTNTNNKEVKLFTLICMILGLFFFTGIIAILQCIINKDRTYAFWAMYLFINALFFAAELNRAFGFGFFTLNIHNSNHIPNPWTTVIQFGVSIMYLLFISSFLEIKMNNKKIYNFINVSIKIMLLSMVLSLFVVLFYDYGFTIYADMFLVVTNILILLTVIFIIRSEIPQKNLLMIGSVGVLLAATFSVGLEITNSQNNWGFWFIPIVSYAIGSVWELAFFSLALSQRSRLIKLENQQLQKNYTTKLELELGQRLDLIKTKDKLLEEQRIESITNSYEQKIVETEIKALRAQMNPHFIFNCLNSIAFFTANNQTEKASEYLSKFSRLIRLVLDNSRSEKVTLKNEFETLRLYIEMEAMRFRGKVKYQINIGNEIDVDNIQIPPLLIQPFVENAIWHGLMHKEEGGEVIIEVSLPADNLLHIEIIDDGVGRNKAAEYKSKSVTKNKSFGMKVTTERIELVNQMYKTNTKIKIIDLENTNGGPLGTKVIVEIPF